MILPLFWDEPAGRPMVAAGVLGMPSIFRAGKGKTKQGEVKKLPGGGVGLAPERPLLRKSAKRTRRSGSSHARTTAPTDPGTESGVFEIFFYI
jgi:hypothetical protein